MTKIFISYARAYETFARQLTASLADQGLSVWLDVKDIPAGTNWSNAIQQGLDWADMMILIMTPESLESNNVADEWQYYLREQKPIVPILLVPPQKTHYQITQLQYIDFHTQSYEQAFDKLCDELMRQGYHPASKPSSLSLMPKPFEWIKIPAGHGMMKAENYDGSNPITLTIPTEDYYISKYPITNAQFDKFIKGGGYDNNKWWPDNSWREYCQKESWTQPRFWTESKWNGAEYPVVGVSWFESVAFCLWLSDVSGEKIMLPTEAQWQYAAQGTDGRQYPSKNGWDANCYNFNTSGTTPVTQYAGKGDSPFGVVDMAGNVWEWCLTDYEKLINNINIKSRERVLRGGSWYFGNTVDLRVVVRNRNFPNSRINSRGFRCVRSVLSK